MLLFGSKFGFGLLSFVSIFIFVFICIDSIDRFTLGHISLLLVLVVLSIIQEIMCIQFSDISIMKCKMMETWSAVYNEQYRI